MNICVQINPSHLYAFKAARPWHAMGEFDYLIAFFTEDGKLVQLDPWVIRSRASLGMTDDHARVTEAINYTPSLAILVEEAAAFGMAETARVLIETGQRGDEPSDEGIIIHILGDDFDGDDDDDDDEWDPIEPTWDAVSRCDGG